MDHTEDERKGGKEKEEEAKLPARDRSRSGSEAGSEAGSGTEGGRTATSRSSSRGRSRKRSAQRKGVSAAERKTRSDVSGDPEAVRRSLETVARVQLGPRVSFSPTPLGPTTQRPGGPSPGGILSPRGQSGTRSAGGVGSGTSSRGTRTYETDDSPEEVDRAPVHRSEEDLLVEQTTPAGGGSGVSLSLVLKGATPFKAPAPPGPAPVVRPAEPGSSAVRARSPSLERRGPGRPITTGIGAERERQKAEREQRAAEEHTAEVERNMLDPAIPVPVPSRTSKPLKKAALIRAEVAGLSVEAMAAVVLTHLAVVDKGYLLSKNIKGDISHNNRQATHATRVILEEITRAASDAPPRPENQAVVEQAEMVHALREENDSLRARLKTLEGRMRDVEVRERQMVTREKWRGRSGEAMDVSPESADDPPWEPPEGGEERASCSTPQAKRGGATHHHTPQSRVGLDEAGVTRVVRREIGGITRELSRIREYLDRVVPHPSPSRPHFPHPYPAAQAPIPRTGGGGAGKKKKKKKGGKAAPAVAPPPQPPLTKRGTTARKESVGRQPSRGRSAQGARTRAEEGARGRSRGGRGASGAQSRSASRARMPPPAAAPPPWDAWSTVVRRGAQQRRGASQQRRPQQQAQPSGQRKREASRPRRAKVPKSAAVVVKCPRGDSAAIMRELRGAIRLSDLEIGGLDTRYGMSGSLILEVSGENMAKKADALAACIREVVKDREGVEISRAEKKADLQIRDLEASISAREVAEAVARLGGCEVTAVQVGEIRRIGRGTGTVIIKCPVAAANRVAGEGRVGVGWTRARVALMEPRPLRCYRCLAPGHVSGVCPSAVDRSNLCHRCGGAGHISRNCEARPRCVVCAAAGRPAGHIAGGRACPVVSRRAAARARKKAAGRESAPPAAAPPRTPMMTTAPRDETAGPTARTPSAADDLDTDQPMIPANKRPLPKEETTQQQQQQSHPPPADWPKPGEAGTSTWGAAESSADPLVPEKPGAETAEADEETRGAKRKKSASKGEGGRSSPSLAAGAKPCSDASPSH